MNRQIHIIFLTLLAGMAMPTHPAAASKAIMFYRAISTLLTAGVGAGACYAYPRMAQSFGQTAPGLATTAAPADITMEQMEAIIARVLQEARSAQIQPQTVIYNTSPAVESGSSWLPSLGIVGVGIGWCIQNKFKVFGIATALSVLGFYAHNENFRRSVNHNFSRVRTGLEALQANVMARIAALQSEMHDGFEATETAIHEVGTHLHADMGIVTDNQTVILAHLHATIAALQNGRPVPEAPALARIAPLPAVVAAPAAAALVDDDAPAPLFAADNRPLWRRMLGW